LGGGEGGDGGGGGGATVAAGDGTGVTGQQQQQGGLPSTHGLALYGPGGLGADTPLADFDQRLTSWGQTGPAVGASHPLSRSMQMGQGAAGGLSLFAPGAAAPAMSTSAAAMAASGYAGAAGGGGGGGGLEQGSSAAAQAELGSWLQRSASLQQRLSQEMVKHEGRMQALTARQQLVEGILANLDQGKPGQQQQQQGAEGSGGGSGGTAGGGGGDQRMQAHKSYHLR
jgi:hypothetical protein